MAAIEKIKFDKNLRPATVEAIKKINETVDAVNSLDLTAIGALQKDVNNLKNTVSTHTSKIDTANSSISALQSTTESHTTDIDKIKVTLYTPLRADENTE